MLIQSYHEKEITQTRFLVTGGAGFIGSNLVEYLLAQKAGLVRVLDNLATGSLDNITTFTGKENFEFLQGDIRNPEDCLEATKDIDIVFNMAALGSVPRSIKEPIITNEVNAGGFVNVLWACNKNGVKRIIFSSSSSIYGLNNNLPLKETAVPQPISPYAVSKYTNELYASVFEKTYGLEYIGLRYFNVFGPRQSPNGAYAAVIPCFINALIEGKSPIINGNGSASRDFTYVDNVIQANIKAAFVSEKFALNTIYNISAGKSISLNELHKHIAKELDKSIKPVYGPERLGDIKNSLADITQAKFKLGYNPTIAVEEGLKTTVSWFKKQALLV
jgi:UDP-N-acetylglucosamine 4-epimerase